MPLIQVDSWCLIHLSGHNKWKSKLDRLRGNVHFVYLHIIKFIAENYWELVNYQSPALWSLVKILQSTQNCADSYFSIQTISVFVLSDYCCLSIWAIGIDCIKPNVICKLSNNQDSCQQCKIIWRNINIIFLYFKYNWLWRWKRTDISQRFTVVK